MGQEYRLVSEDEWQTLRDELAWHKAEAKRLEVEGARLENEVYNLRWQYSHEDPNADEPECGGEWFEHAKVETVWRYDADGNLIYKGPPECDCSQLSEVCEAGPQRPHESLVWAIFYQHALSLWPPPVKYRELSLVGRDADAMLEAWKKRWPESEE